MNQEHPVLEHNSDTNRYGRHFWLKWTGVTAAAWGIGLLLGFLLAGLITELLAFILDHPYDSMFGNIVLGFVLGATVGWAQRLLLRQQILLPVRWLLIPGILLSVGYAILEISLYLIIGGENPPPVPLWSILQIILFALAGAASGFLQSRIWPKHWLWIVGNAVGWGAALTLIQQSTLIQTSAIPDFVLFLSGLVFSGLLLGLFTGLALSRMSNQKAVKT